MTASQLNLRAQELVVICNAVVAVLEELSNVASGTQFRLDIHTNMIVKSYSGQSAEIIRLLEEFCESHKDSKYLICYNLTVFSPTFGQSIMTYACSDGIKATIDLHPSVNNSYSAMIAKTLGSFLNIFSFSDLAGLMAPGPAENTALRIRETSAADLHAHLKKLSDLMSDLAVREVDSRRRISAELQQEQHERISQFEAQKKQWMEDFESLKLESQEEIRKKKEDLEQRQAEFELRESKAVRRVNQTKLESFLESLKGSGGDVSLEVIKKRRPIYWSTLGMIVIFLAVSAISGVNYFSKLDMRYLPTFAGSLLALSATGIYFIRWNDYWFRTHAENEIQARRYKIDMLRAAWVAEYVQECSADGKEAPKELLEVFSRSLFQQTGKHSDVEHPMEQVLGLLKRANKVDIGKGRIAIESESSSK